MRPTKNSHVRASCRARKAFGTLRAQIIVRGSRFTPSWMQPHLGLAECLLGGREIGKANVTPAAQYSRVARFDQQ